MHAHQNEIRQIGDPVLHREAAEIKDFSPKGLSLVLPQVDILKKILYATGGAGIAANQCAAIEHPLQIIIVGVNHQNPEHVTKSSARYPGISFPPMQIHLNPKIIHMGTHEETFAEGCLSVQGILRAQVLRPSSLTIQYQDLAGNTHVNALEGNNARVMQHEVDHILNGKVYIQRIFEELNQPQIKRILQILEPLLQHARYNENANPFSEPKLIFKRDQHNKIIFDDEELKIALTDMPLRALQGMYEELQKRKNV